MLKTRPSIMASSSSSSSSSPRMGTPSVNADQLTALFLTPPDFWPLAQITDYTLSCLCGYAPNNSDRQKSYAGCTNISSTRQGWQRLRSLASTGQPLDIEVVAASVHDGWASAAMQTWDTNGYGEPPPVLLRRPSDGRLLPEMFTSERALKKYQTRQALADTPYAALSEENKVKDRIVAEVLAACFVRHVGEEAATPIVRIDQETLERVRSCTPCPGFPF